MRKNNDIVTPTDLALRIKAFRTALNYTQIQMAKEIDVTVAVFHSWETGKHSPRADKLQKFANVIGVNLNDMIQVKPDYIKSEPDYVEYILKSKKVPYLQVNSLKEPNTVDEILNKASTINIDIFEDIKPYLMEKKVFCLDNFTSAMTRDHKQENENSLDIGNKLVICRVNDLNLIKNKVILFKYKDQIYLRELIDIQDDSITFRAWNFLYDDMTIHISETLEIIGYVYAFFQKI